MTYYQVGPKSEPLLTCVFKSEQGGALRCRSIYRKYSCAQCGRIDSGTALKEIGLDTAFTVELGKRDLADTYDYMGIVSDRLRKLLESACDCVDFYEVLGSGDCHVMWPKSVIVPDDSAAYSRSEQCQACGSFRSVVFGPSAISTLPDASMGAILLEGPQGPLPAWYVNVDIAKQIKQEKMKGVSLVKWIELCHDRD